MQGQRLELEKPPQPQSFPGVRREPPALGDTPGCRTLSLSFSMSVPQAMEWLIEHADDPTIDTPLPGQASPREAGAEAPAEAAAGSSEGDEEARDELTEIFKKIRRKRAFRADSRVCVSGPGSRRVDPPLPRLRLRCLSRATDLGLS